MFLVVKRKHVEWRIDRDQASNRKTGDPGDIRETDKGEGLQSVLGLGKRVSTRLRV